MCHAVLYNVVSLDAILAGELTVEGIVDKFPKVKFKIINYSYCIVHSVFWNNNVENIVLYMQVSVIKGPNCTFYRLQASPSPYTNLFLDFMMVW